MTVEKLTNSEVLQIEVQVDRQFDRTSLPTSDLNTARWIVCTVNEDVNRLALLELSRLGTAKKLGQTEEDLSANLTAPNTP